VTADSLPARVLPDPVLVQPSRGQVRLLFDLWVENAGETEWLLTAIEVTTDLVFDPPAPGRPTIAPDELAANFHSLPGAEWSAVARGAPETGEIVSRLPGAGAAA
jgi:hypothetical protein